MASLPVHQVQQFSKFIKFSKSIKFIKFITLSKFSIGSAASAAPEMREEEGEGVWTRLAWTAHQPSLTSLMSDTIY
jgi:hypothetical protein